MYISLQCFSMAATIAAHVARSIEHEHHQGDSLITMIVNIACFRPCPVVLHHAGRMQRCSPIFIYCATFCTRNMGFCARDCCTIGMCSLLNEIIRADMVLEAGALPPLQQLLATENNATRSMVRNATWTLSNFCRGKPAPHFELTKAALPTLRYLISQPTGADADDEIMTDACWALSYLSDGPNERIQVCVAKHVILLYSLFHNGAHWPVCKNTLLVHPAASLLFKDRPNRAVMMEIHTISSDLFVQPLFLCGWRCPTEAAVCWHAKCGVGRCAAGSSGGKRGAEAGGASLT